ncbi:hypothetical protein KDL44_01350 [bacterium]|nr:hypothetical protein [bacterium]
MILQMLVSSVLVPGLVALTLSLFLWKARYRQQESSPYWASAAILAVSFLTGWVLMRGIPKWPVTDSAGWLPVLAIGGLALGLLVSMQKLHGVTTGVLRLLACLGTVWVSTQSLQQHTWKGTAGIWIAGLTLILFLVWNCWELVASRSPGPRAPLMLALFFTGLAILALLGETATISQLTGVLCAALGAMFVAALIRPALSLSQAALFVAMPLFGGLLLNAHFYAGMELLQTVLLLSCSALALLGLQLTKRSSGLAGIALAALIMFLPALLGIGWELLNREPHSDSSGMDEYYEDYYGY